MQKLQQDLEEARDAAELWRLDAEALELEKEELEEALALARTPIVQQQPLFDDEEVVQSLCGLVESAQSEAKVLSERFGAAEAAGSAAVAYLARWQPELQELRLRRRDLESSARVVEALSEKNAALAETEDRLRLQLKDADAELAVLRELDDAQNDELAYLGRELAAAERRAESAESEAATMASIAQSLADDSDQLKNVATAALDSEREALRQAEIARRDRRRADLRTSNAADDDADVEAALRAYVIAEVADGGDPSAAAADANACAAVARAAKRLESCGDNLTTSIAEVTAALEGLARRMSLDVACAPPAASYLAAAAVAARAATALGDADPAVMAVRRELAGLDEDYVFVAWHDDAAPPAAFDDAVLAVLHEGPDALARLADAVRAASRSPGCAEQLARIALACRRGHAPNLAEARGDRDRRAKRREDDERRDADKRVARRSAQDAAEAAAAAHAALAAEARRAVDLSTAQHADLAARYEALETRLAASTAKCNALDAAVADAMATAAQSRDDATTLGRALEAQEQANARLEARLVPTTPTKKGPRSPRGNPSSPRSPPLRLHLDTTDDTPLAELADAALGALLPPLPPLATQRSNLAPRAHDDLHRLITDLRKLRSRILDTETQSAPASVADLERRRAARRRHAVDFRALKQRAVDISNPHSAQPRSTSVL